MPRAAGQAKGTPCGLQFVRLLAHSTGARRPPHRAPGTPPGAGSRPGLPQATLPEDLRRLWREAGLRSFEAVPIGPAGGAPLGAVLMGRHDPSGFGCGGGSPGGGEREG
jgi:hypothetical protein